MRFRNILFVLLLSAPLYFIQEVRAQKITHSTRNEAKTPEEELAGFTVPEGFVIELVASERNGIVNPIDLTFDDAGRLWTQTANMYPLDPIADIQWNDLLNLMNDPEIQKNHPSFKRILDLYQGKTRGKDKILVLSDLYGEAPVKTTVWADGLTIPQSILPYKDGAYVAQGSELFLLKDTDKDGDADQRTPLFTGFGYTDTHTMAHSLVRAPGGWIHFSHGALNKGEVSSLQSDLKLRMDYSKIARFSMDGKRMEVLSSGLNNIWGFQLRHNGEWYGSEANDLGFSSVPMEPGVGFPGIGNERIRSYQPWMPPLHDFRVGGTGISGTAFADDSSGSFPDEWKDVAFLANPITSSINAVKITHNPDGSVTAAHLPDLLTSKDDWFRPVNMEFGPDGCLYIADWYNKIVSHNELPTTHPDRDKSHGRIWRIRHVSQTPRSIPDFYEVKTEDLVGYLKSPSLWAKRAVWHQITDRPHVETKNLAQELITLAADEKQDEITRIHALWSLEGIKHYEEELMTDLLTSPLHHLRREAVRSLTSFSLQPADLSVALRERIEDENPAVRSQAIRTLSKVAAPDPGIIHLLVQAAKPELPGTGLGGPYERKLERFLVRKALEAYPMELQAYLNTPMASQVPVENKLWVLQALPTGQKEKAFLKWWPQSDLPPLDQYTFVSIVQMLDNQEVYEAVKTFFHDPSHTVTYINMALQNQAQVQSPELAALFEIPVNKLLQSNVGEEVDLALDALARFNILYEREKIIALINEQTSDNTLTLALKVLENNPAANQAVFSEVFQNKNYGFERRVSALHILSKASQEAGELALKKWSPTLSSFQKQELVDMLSGSKEGSSLLLTGYEQGLIEAESFNRAAAERINQTYPMDPQGLDILEEAIKLEEEKKNAFTTTLHRYMTIAEKNGGDAVKGKVLFQTCLMCHSVGDEGQDIAPALDGSANRENEALLTAIIDPDAAVESNYVLYRVTKKDGSTVEGYLVSRVDRGSTIAFMGGNEVFIPSGEIRSQGFVGGRSFMLKGLMDGYTDAQVADLLSYIRTLK